MALLGHRWQVLRASITILFFLENRISGLSLPASVEKGYKNHLAETRSLLEGWKTGEASANIRALMEKVRADLAGGGIGQADADVLTEPLERLLELIEK
ncbi:MAG: hypothetical protein IIC13_12180 [SAR324 cluster bacterium]|nr:hypothetical protein [SAR324 cluster bacterium]